MNEEVRPLLKHVLAWREGLDIQRGQRGQDKAGGDQELNEKHRDFLSYNEGVRALGCKAYANLIYEGFAKVGPRKYFSFGQDLLQKRPQPTGSLT